MLFSQERTGYAPSQLFFEPDDGAGSGGAGAATVDPPAADMITLAEADERTERAVQQRLKSAHAKITKLEERQAADAAKIAELQQKVQDAADTATAEQQAIIDDLQAQLAASQSGEGEVEQLRKQTERMQQKFEKTIADLQRQVESERAAREAATEAAAASEAAKVLERQERERERLLSEALSAAGCTDLKRASRFFQDQVVFDDVEERVVFRAEDGTVHDVSEGIQAELPDYWRPAKNKGGSGTPSGTPRPATLQNPELAKLQAELKLARQKVAQSGASSVHLLEVSRLSRRIKEIESQSA